jgi:DNA-binding NtrC family response regulator
VIVECADIDAARADRLLFGAPVPDAPTDLESISSDGRVAAARGGTLFLQDVPELPAAVQARLARIARDGEMRLDGAQVAAGFRLVASATPAIDADVNAHRFRVDLFRRLSAARIDLPPLRDRAEDVPALAMRLLDDICDARAIPRRSFTQAALALVGALTWPGNAGELRSALERAVNDARDDVVQIEHLLPALQLRRVPAPFTPAGNLREARLRFERDYIAAVLQHHGWRMAAAAETLGIQRPNLYRKARQLGIPLTRISD